MATKADMQIRRTEAARHRRNGVYQPHMGRNRHSTRWENLETEKCYRAFWAFEHKLGSIPARTEVWWRSSFNHSVAEANVDYTGRYILSMTDKVVKIDTSALRGHPEYAKTVRVVLYKQDAKFLQFLEGL